MKVRIIFVTGVATVVGLCTVAVASGTGASANPAVMQSDTHGQGAVLHSVRNPKQALANDAVDDSSGTTIGHVKSVETYKSGHARTVMVSLMSENKTVAIPQRDLRYDEATNTLAVKLTKAQIEALSPHT